MKLVSVKLGNFRCYKNETCISFDDLTAFIGLNEAGKSAILDALEIYFGGGVPDRDDATVGGDRKNVTISCEFRDFPSEVVIDATTKTSLASEHLLNARNHFEAAKEFNCDLSKPKLSGTYARALHPTATKHDDLLQLKNKDLQTRASQLGIDLEKTDKRCNVALRKAIWSSEHVRSSWLIRPTHQG